MKSELLGREALLTKEKLEIVKVQLNPKQHVFVRQMTGAERDQFEQTMLVKTTDKKGNATYESSTENYRAKLAVITVCNEEGALLFKSGDHLTLGKAMSALTLEKIIKVAQEINGITGKDEEAIVKNSKPVQEGSSSSDSVES